MSGWQTKIGREREIGGGRQKDKEAERQKDKKVGGKQRLAEEEVHVN